tara:strand:- start:1982 stop:2761 length:780 start_codon:yes stop_codon:yes gene_type:complete
MQMKLLDKKKHLDNLQRLVYEQGHNSRSLAVKTANAPVGFGEMSHTTISSYLKPVKDGEEIKDIKFNQLQEFSRILGVKINKLISDDVPKIEIIQYFNRENSHFVPRQYDQPIELIYSLKDLYMPSSYKALYWNADGFKKVPAFSIIDMDHKDWAKDKSKRDALLYVDAIFKCAKDGLYYYGHVLDFNKDGTAVFQQWKGTFMNQDKIEFTEQGEKVTYDNMMINKWEKRNKCEYEAIYPQISNISLFQTDYKVEQISL